MERVIHAQEAERLRVSRQMHDGPAQTMTNLVLRAEICERLLDIDVARARVELAGLKTMVNNTLQATRGFESEQAAADDNRFHSLSGAIQQRARVIQIAEDVDTFFLHAFHRGNQRITSGREQKFVERRNGTVVTRHGSRVGVNVRNAYSQPQLNVVLPIPFEQHSLS